MPEFAQVGDFCPNEACADCHEDVTNAFASNVHGRLADFELVGWQKGCESCHGKASLHVDSDGDTAKVLNPAALDPAEAEAICVGCHIYSILLSIRSPQQTGRRGAQ